MMKLKKLVEKLYHRTIFLPETMNKFLNRYYKLVYSSHAKIAAKTDRYGIIDLTKIDKMPFLKKEEIVEVETTDSGDVVKFVVRKPYNKKFDVVLAIMPDITAGTALVKTIWLNDKKDSHITLRKNLYSDK